MGLLNRVRPIDQPQQFDHTDPAAYIIFDNTSVIGWRRKTFSQCNVTNCWLCQMGQNSE
ncbi:MAG: hypothetical protein O3A80_03840 [bacterium]|nr:hypothetical protein [bacterium]